MSEDQPLPEAVVAAIQSGRKIEAIKILRGETGLGLKEAKHAVDVYVQRHPDLESNLGTASESPFGRLLLIGAAVAAAIAIYRYFS